MGIVKNVVVYTENGLENDIKLNMFNKNSFLVNKLGKCESSNNYYFWRKPDLEVIYFYKYKFSGNSILFDGDLKDRIVIFDNCIFEGEDISFSYCNVEMINPKFLSENKIKIKVEKVDDFSVVLDEDNYWDNLSFDVSKCKMFSLDGSTKFCNLMVFADYCYINNFNNYKSLVLSASKKIKLSNCGIRFECFYQNGLIKTDKLILENTSIIDGYRDDLGDIFSLSINSISGYDYEVKIKYDLSIHNDVYSNKGDCEYLTLFSDKDLSDGNIVMARRDLISVLKGLRQRVSSDINKEVLRKKDFYQDELLLQKKKVNKERLILKELEEKISSEVDCYKRDLSNQSISKIRKL